MMVKFEDKTPVDFVVIGGGGAGAIVAKELSAAGFQVVILEQGPYLHEGDFEHDELKFKDIWEPPGIGQEALTNDHALQPNTFRKTETEKAVVAPFVQYGRCVGGGTVHFTGNYWRFHEVDFQERSRWGELPGTGLADWPITYAELEPYYTRAEWELGVSGVAGANPFDPPRSKPYPLPPLPVKSSGVLLERGARKLGWHAYPAPMAILSQPYKERPACQHCGFCDQFGCEWGAKSSTLATVIPIAESTGRCEIRINSYVRKISTDRRGRIDGVIYFDGQKQEHLQKAKAVVVCCNGAETPRLLLMSTSNLFPKGLANSSGLVGKFFMLDLGCMCLGTFDQPLNEYKSVRVTRVVQDFYDSDPKRGFFGGGGIDARFEFYPISFALNGLPPNSQFDFDIPGDLLGFNPNDTDAAWQNVLQIHKHLRPVETARIDDAVNKCSPVMEAGNILLLEISVELLALCLVLCKFPAHFFRAGPSFSRCFADDVDVPS